MKKLNHTQLSKLLTEASSYLIEEKYSCKDSLCLDNHILRHPVCEMYLDWMLCDLSLVSISNNSGIIVPTEPDNLLRKLEEMELVK